MSGNKACETTSLWNCVLNLRTTSGQNHMQLHKNVLDNQISSNFATNSKTLLEVASHDEERLLCWHVAQKHVET